eukprot:3238482-Ditylum_brightwellii.AAC.1
MKVIAAERQSTPFMSLSSIHPPNLLATERSNVKGCLNAGIDATALVPEYQVSSSEHVILDEATLNDFISVKDFTKDQILQLSKECQAEHTK